jgi:hypothetical protein
VRFPWPGSTLSLPRSLSWRLLLTCGTLWVTEYRSDDNDDDDNDRHHGQHQSIPKMVGSFLRSR